MFSRDHFRHHTSEIASGLARPWRSFACQVLLVLGIWGCASTVRHDAAIPDSVPLPVYQEGTTYIFSNGKTETVDAVTKDSVTWRNQRGYLSTGFSDFTYRRAQWESGTRSGTRSFRKRSNWLGGSSETSLWPLAAGKMVRYTESGRWWDAAGKVHVYQSNWRVEVVGREKVRVKAGTFEAWKIVARRFSGGGLGKTRVREIRTWYYAREAGHYVKLARQYPGRRPGRTIELVAILPPLDHLDEGMQSQVNTNFQMALENNPSGVPLPWHVAGQTFSGTTTPTATFQLKSGAYCRQYVQTVTGRGNQHSFYGLACRTAKGDWIVPHQ